jgi:hypothetical protein
MEYTLASNKKSITGKAALSRRLLVDSHHGEFFL